MGNRTKIVIQPTAPQVAAKQRQEKLADLDEKRKQPGKITLDDIYDLQRQNAEMMLEINAKLVKLLAQKG